MRGLSIRLAIAAVVFTGFLLVYGFVEITESLRFRTPRIVTYAQFKKEMPQEGWFRIKNAQLNVVESAIEEDKTTHTIKKAFVPITSLEDITESKDDKTYLLMETKDTGIIDTVRDGQGIADEKAAMKFVAANSERAFPTRDVEGMIKTGLNADSKTRNELAKLDNSLAPNYAILQEGKHPSLGMGIGMLLGGIALAVGQILFYLGRRAMGR